jgi:hypothetical protein
MRKTIIKKIKDDVWKRFFYIGMKPKYPLCNWKVLEDLWDTVKVSIKNMKTKEVKICCMSKSLINFDNNVEYD